ncbi:MAG: pesticidal protein Cry22Aa [Anaerolineales bacterium]|nr:pesticidal protein Cry22Aa [Anaerolineales bacterium]
MFQSLLFVVVMPALVLGVVFAFVRLVRGPDLSDRVVSLDIISIFGIALIASYALATGQPVFIDVAGVLALVSFLGTVAFAAYVERRS